MHLAHDDIKEASIRFIDSSSPRLMPADTPRTCDWLHLDWSESDCESIALGLSGDQTDLELEAFVTSPFGGPMSISQCKNSGLALSVLPALSTCADAPSIFSQYFSNELFFADSLHSLPSMFLNYDFQLFPKHCVLFPCPPMVVLDHELCKGYRSLYRNLILLEGQANKLAAAVCTFNSQVRQLTRGKPSLEELIEKKLVLLNLVSTHLGSGIHGVTDIIINALYDCNLQAETLAARPKPLVQAGRIHLLDREGAHLLRNLRFCHARIEAILKGALPDLGTRDTSEFRRWLDAEFIHNPEYAALVQQLRIVG